MTQQSPSQRRARIYAYVDESGDEGFADPYTDRSLYRDRAKGLKCPSHFFALTAVLIKDEDRTAIQQRMRTIAAAIYPNQPTNEIHWRRLTPAEKTYACGQLADLPFLTITAIAHKPTVEKAFKAPYLYNYMVRLVLERACLQAKSDNRDLLPTFSWRSRTNYEELEDYIFRETDAFGAKDRLLKFRKEQQKKERLLQLADMCCSAFENALEHDKNDAICADYIKALWTKVRRYGKRVRGYGIKTYPEAMTSCGHSEQWLRQIS